MKSAILLFLLPVVAIAGDPRRIERDGVTVDLAGEVLAGPDAGGAPDAFTGIGILVDGRRDVTIRGGRLHGFRCAILVRNSENVVLDGIDVSGNFCQRLKSTPEREDATDWLRPHDNDEQQWRRRYGAGICIENSRRVAIRNCVGRHQQNGILLDRCTGCVIHDNDMSFNSGWGCALWRSSNNVISRNRFDWCVRGYSHGVYARGQDSAGILVFEQCHDNRFALNSATHGGDGFFLFAGNDTLQRTGKGGCNGNLVWRNDFSHAVANGIEATFSTRNRFVENTCDDANYGIWAGYSYGCEFADNVCRKNRVAGIAIEHGEDHLIRNNRFADNPCAIRLWWDDDKDLLATPFAAVRSCRSRGYRILANRFEGDAVAVFLRDTTGAGLRDNRFEGVGTELETRGVCGPVARGADVALPAPAPPVAGPFPGRFDPFRPRHAPRGMDRILIGEWGPLDPDEAQVFPRDVTGWGECVFFVLGSGGAGYEVRGLAPGLVVEKLERSFRVRGGGSGLVPFRAEVAVGGHVFAVRGLLLNATWRVRHWNWKRDPRSHPDAWTALLASPPAATIESRGVAWTWGGAGPAGVAPDRFATRAETRMTLPAGRYAIRTLSDDGVRVIIDGRTVQDDWTWHGPTEHRDVVELEAGEHEIVVEHFELDGYAVLHFDLRPAK